MYTKHILVRNLEYKQIAEQPEMSHNKNCTALVLIRSPSGNFPMITIPCNVKYNTKVFCQSTNRPFVLRKGLTLVNSRHCDDDWFTTKGATKCFSFSWTKREISYNDAHKLCMSQNATVLTSEVGPVILEDIHPKLKRKYVYYNVTELLIMHFALGQRLSKRSPHSRLPAMIHSLSEEATNIFVTNLSNKCSLVGRHSPQINYFTPPTGPILKWLVKCQPCAEATNVSAVICEKQRRPNIPHCDDQYFTCDDGTCILLIYKCDLISDCFDNSDEESCIDIIDNSWFNSSLTLPCHQGVLCDGSEQITPLHMICDGIYSNTTFVQEKYACWKFELQHINIMALSKDSEKVHKRLKRVSPCKVTHKVKSVIGTLFYEHVSDYNKCIDHNKIIDKSKYHSEIVVNDSIVCAKKHDTSFIDNCKIGVNASDVAVATAYDDPYSCLWVTCPGMFKCLKSFCIYLSAVCDGQWDCQYGDDEQLCPILSCSGFLKCRGENRCVSSEEICDKHINCVYSMDDEVGCTTCPDHCYCEGFSMSCEVNNSLDVILASHINHVKGFVMKGVQNIFNMTQIHFIGLVHLNISFCHIKKVEVQPNKWIGRIAITDISHNNLVNIHFLNNSLFTNSVFLDLSFNIITMINNLFLNKLVFLALTGNPLKEIDLHAFRHNFKSLIDMQHINYRRNMHLKFASAFANQLEVKVSEPMICCIMSTDIRCTSSSTKIDCFGLFNIKIEQISAYCITLLSVIAAIALLVKYILSFWLLRRKLTNKKKYFTIILCNRSAAVAVNSMYMLGILVADVTNVNVYVWTKSQVCILLNSFLFISLVSDMIFKTVLLIFVSLQIIYPFKHQCLWIRWSAVFSGLVWLFVCSTYSLNVIEHFMFKETYLLDLLCSVVGCGVKETINLSLSVICLSDCLMISLSIYMLIQTHVHLVKSGRNIDMTVKHGLKNIKIILKLSCQVLLETPFRLSLLCLLAIQLSSTPSTQFCNYTFMYILPINMICGFLVSVYRH